MKTQHIIEDLVALIRMADHGDAVVDPVAWESRLPHDLPAARAYVQTACAIIDVLTSGPQQEALLSEMVTLAAGITATPDEGGGQ